MDIIDELKSDENIEELCNLARERGETIRLLRSEVHTLQSEVNRRRESETMLRQRIVELQSRLQAERIL